MKKNSLLIFFILSLSIVIKAQSKKQSLAIIRQDANSYIVYSDGTKEKLPFFVIETEGASEGLSRAKIMMPDKKVTYAYLDKDGKIMILPKLPSNYEGRFLPIVNDYVKFMGYDKNSDNEISLIFDNKGNMLFGNGFEITTEVGTNDWIFLHGKNHHGYYDMSLKKRLSLPDSLSGYYRGFSGNISLIWNDEFIVGAINDKGKIILPVAYEERKVNLLEGILFLQEDENLKLIDKEGKSFKVLENARFDRDYIAQFKDGLLALHTFTDEVILVNKKGKKLMTISNVKQIIEFDGKILTGISQDDKYVAYSKKGKLINTFAYKHLGGFVDGYSYFFDGNKGGFVNIEGKELILDWDVLWDIRNGSLFF